MSGATSRLLPALLIHAPQMNFFRFCELIELAAPDQALLGNTDTPASESVRFASSARLGFPAREIAYVEADSDHTGKPATVRTTFLGLYGVDACMPSYFVDEVAQNRDGAEPLAAFLDLFHHRMLTQYYRIWRKYRYPAGFRGDACDQTSRYLFSLVGLGIDQPYTAQEVGPRKLLAMLGLASQKTRTAEGLAGILQHAVPDAQLTVEECYPLWLSAEGYEQPGLGEGYLLGRGFYDRANSVRVVITPHTTAAVVGLMPGREMHREVMALLRFYLGYEARACLEMRVAPDLMPAPVLNSSQVSLGYTTQLAQRNAPRLANTTTRVQFGVWTAGTAGNPAASPARRHNVDANQRSEG